MRRLSRALIAIALILPGCMRAAAPTRSDEDRHYPAADGKLVRVDLGSLDVAVHVTAASEIRVRVHLAARASSSRAASRWLERNTPVIEDSPAALEIRAPARRHAAVLFGFFTANGKVEIEMPPTCRLEIATASGDVALAGPARLAEAARVRTASGDVRIDGGAAAVVVRTASGDVRVEGERLALLDVETGSGRVRLGAGADKVVADTASGDIHLLGLTGDLSADTSSGDVWGSWQSLVPQATVHVTTSSGGVVLRLPSGPSPSGELRTTSGRILSQAAGRWDEHHRRQSLSGDGPRLEVRTTSGNITVAAS